MYIFANKADLVAQDELDEANIKKMVEDNNLQGYYLTSAIIGSNVIKAFNDIIEDLYKKAKMAPPQDSFRKLEVKKRKKKKIRKGW